MPDLLEHLMEEVESLMIAEEARVYAHDHLEADDDDYQFVEDGLDRWGDRSFRDPAWDCFK